MPAYMDPIIGASLSKSNHVKSAMKSVFLLAWCVFTCMAESLLSVNVTSNMWNIKMMDNYKLQKSLTFSIQYKNNKKLWI